MGLHWVPWPFVKSTESSTIGLQYIECEPGVHPISAQSVARFFDQTTWTTTTSLPLQIGVVALASMTWSIEDGVGDDHDPFFQFRLMCCRRGRRKPPLGRNGGHMLPQTREMAPRRPRSDRSLSPRSRRPRGSRGRSPSSPRDCRSGRGIGAEEEPKLSCPASTRSRLTCSVLPNSSSA